MDDGYLLAVGANLVFAHVQRVQTFPVWNEGEHKVRPYGPPAGNTPVPLLCRMKEGEHKVRPYGVTVFP